MAASLRVSKMKTVTGVTIEPTVEQTPSLVSYVDSLLEFLPHLIPSSCPVPYKCHIVPRYDGVVELIEQSRAASAL